MAVRKILTAPDPILREISKPVAEVTDETRALVADMFDSMYAEKGIGLAAVQIGVPLRIIVMDLARNGEEPQKRVFINPEILSASDEMFTYEEGCLSVPEYFDEVDRPAQVTVRYLDENGKQHEEEAVGLFAVCIQHEMDHLEGKLFIDYLSKLRRGRAMDKVKKVVRQRERNA